MKKIFVLFAAALLMAGCGHTKVQLIDAAQFNKQVDGKQVSLYTLHNGDLTMQVTNYGGRVVALWTPDVKGNMANVVVGYDHIDKYLNNDGERYLGAVVGRCANRIAGASFTLNDVEYQLSKNEGENTLHGGELGADRVVWDVVSANDSALVLHVVFPDGQDGFPGNLDVTMTYTLTRRNEFRVDYLATTDQPTLCNLSHHSFFNLKGDGSTILDHELTINGPWFLPVDEKLIPTGNFLSVKDTPFDFTEPHAIGERIYQKHPQLVNGHGYDHCWVITTAVGGKVVPVASLYEPASGRCMEVLSDQMGLQFYSGNFFDTRCAVALETQKFPDAIHQKNFADKAILNPGEQYTQTCIYKFSVRQ